MGRRTRQLGHVVRHPLRHWRVLRLLEKARREGLAAADQSTGWKYLGSYLAAGLDTGERAGLIAAHYRYLLTRLPVGALRRRWAEGVRLWWRDVEDTRYAIRLAQATFCPMEGEAELSFFRNDKRLFTLTFSLVPGRLLGLAAERAMFIGSMQGGYACRQDNRTAARDNGEVAPATMLILAARAVAEALSIRSIAAVSSDRQAATAHAGEKISFQYDDYWKQLGAARLLGGLFMLNSPGAAQRSLSHLSAAHRKRALRKARYKAALATDMLQNAQRWLEQPTPAASEVQPGGPRWFSARPWLTPYRSWRALPA